MEYQFTFTRDAYVPTGATRVTDKGSDAVAFLYVGARGRPGAVAFHGTAQRPDWNRVFPGEAARERAVTMHFEGRRSVAASRAERQTEAMRPHGMAVGHVLVASWGYDQTNLDFFQVTATVGRCMVEVRPIGKSDASTGKEPWATGKAMPAIDDFTGGPMRRRVNGRCRAVRIDGVRTAFIWNGRPEAWTAYA